MIGSLFIKPEWSTINPTLSDKSVWQNWPDVLHRYPVALILLCALVIALGTAGNRLNRPRLLVMAWAVGCLVLGESVPLIYLHGLGWGLGRWLGILGASIAVVGLTVVVAPLAADRAAATAPLATTHDDGTGTLYRS